MAKLTEVADTTVTADLNHPLAGQNLTFEIEVITVEEPS
jgi:FKBP-type peptidyl-prolyl cis-trans isomerase SlpA